MLQATYLGGSGDDEAVAMTLDSSGNVYVAGSTTANFPGTAGGYQAAYGGGIYDVFIAHITANLASPSVSLSSTSGPVGTIVTVSGSFAANSAVTIKYGGVTQTTTGTCTTNGSGNLPSGNNCAFTVPASVAGAHTVQATDALSNTASATFTVLSSVSLSPTSGSVGTTVTVTVSGSGFAALSTVTIKYDSITVTTSPATVTTDTLGSIPSGVTFTVSASSRGSHTILVTDGSNTASSTFTFGAPFGGSASGYAPSFTTGFGLNEYPLSINGINFKLDNHVNTASTVHLDTGKPFLFKMLLNGDQGYSSVQHVSLFTNLRDRARELQQSDTVIVWDKSDQPQLSVTDPHGYFGQVTVNAIPNGNKLEFDFDITFAKPMATSDIIIRAWDTARYSSDTYLLNAWNSVPGSVHVSSSNVPQESAALINNATTTHTSQPANSQPWLSNPVNPQPSPSQTKPDVMESIKDWAGYSPHPISNHDLLNQMNINAQRIPSWVGKTAKWVVDGSVTTQEFVNVLKYLNEKGIVK